MIGQVDLPVIIVDKVTKTGGVDDGKAETDTILLDVWRKIGSGWRSGHGRRQRVVTSTDTLDGNGLGSFGIWGERFFRGIKRGVEESVN